MESSLIAAQVNNDLTTHYCTLSYLIATKTTAEWRDGLPVVTCMCENVPLEVVATPESAVAVVTDEVLLDFQGTVIIHVHRWKYML